MKVLLVTSPHLNHSGFLMGADRANALESTRYAQCFAPMGLLSVAGAAGSEATIEIADINKAINQHRLPMSSGFYDEAANWLLSYSADMIGFMTEVDSYHHLLRICQSIKARKPQTITLLGGVHASAAHYETLRDFQEVDLIVKGEGENAFRSLLTTLKSDGDLTEVGNLSYRDGSRIVSTYSLPLIDDLDTLPFPDLSYFELTPEDIIYLEVGRGCPFKCNFCFTASYWQRKHRIKSPARVMREIAYFKDSYGRTDFNFTHDLLTTDRRWVIDFCRQLAATDLNVTWTCSSRTDTIDEEQIYWMRRSGCREIYFGVETGTAEMQTKIDKNLDLDEAERIIGKCLEAGIGATVGFIAGLPGESDTSLRSTLKKAFYFLGLSGTTIHLFGFHPNLGSPHFEKIKPNLVFDDHFVDFPLSDEVHAENCRLMESHFDTFTRYSRLSSYEGLDVGVIRAADEFFPMVNALRQLMLRVYAHVVDPLDILIAWTDSIASKNRERASPSARLYQGTLNDFLDFLESYLQTKGLLEAVTAEMIRWERRKNVFRSQSNPQPFVRLEERDGERLMYANQSLLIDYFEHAHEFIKGSKSSMTGTFAFYARRDGTPSIVHLEPIALLMLDLAKQGLAFAELLDEVETLVDAPPDASLSGRQALSSLLERLESVDLLIPATVSDEVATGTTATHEGIKQGYIPLVT
jgi:hypothetical protein